LDPEKKMKKSCIGELEVLFGVYSRSLSGRKEKKQFL
jgi:hypothetical protein